MGLILTRQPSGVARLTPEFFDRSALCFLPNSLHVKNLAKNNAGKVLTRVSPVLKGSLAGRGVACSTTTRAYLDTNWIDPISTSNGAGTGAFSLLFNGTLASSGTRSLPFHIRQNDGNFNSVFVIQNGYAIDGIGSMLSESGSIYLGTYDGLVGAYRGLKLASVLTATPTQITCLYNRYEDGTASLWVNGVQVATQAVGTQNDITVGTVMHLSLGGNAVTDNFSCSDPSNLIYAANRSFSDTQSAKLSRNPWHIFSAPDERILVSVAAADGATGTLATTNANDSVSAAGTTTVTGAAAKTNANDTGAAAGTTTVVGTSAITNAADTSAASGSSGSVTGTADVENSNDTVSASGTAQSNASGGGFWLEFGDQIRQRPRPVQDDADEIAPFIEPVEPEPEPAQPETPSDDKEARALRKRERESQNLRHEIDVLHNVLGSELQSQYLQSLQEQSNAEQQLIAAELLAELQSEQQRTEELDVVFITMALLAIA